MPVMSDNQVAVLVCAAQRLGEWVAASNLKDELPQVRPTTVGAALRGLWSRGLLERRSIIGPAVYRLVSLNHARFLGHNSSAALVIREAPDGWFGAGDIVSLGPIAASSFLQALPSLVKWEWRQRGYRYRLLRPGKVLREELRKVEQAWRDARL